MFVTFIVLIQSIHPVRTFYTLLKLIFLFLHLTIQLLIIQINVQGKQRMCFNGCRREKLKSYAREITGGVTVFILKNSTNVWGSRGKLQLVKEAGKCKYFMNKDFTHKNPSSLQYFHLPASLTNCKRICSPTKGGGKGIK